MIQFDFFDGGKLLITKYIGNIDKESVSSYIRYVFTKFNCEDLRYLISDFRDSNMAFNPKDLEDISKTRKEVDPGIIQKHTVFLVNTPRETAFVNLISNDYNKNLHPAGFYLTLRGCISALSLEIDEIELDRRLNELKFEFTEEE